MTHKQSVLEQLVNASQSGETINRNEIALACNLRERQVDDIVHGLKNEAHAIDVSDDWPPVYTYHGVEASGDGGQ